MVRPERFELPTLSSAMGFPIRVTAAHRKVWGQHAYFIGSEIWQPTLRNADGTEN